MEGVQGNEQDRGHACRGTVSNMEKSLLRVIPRCCSCYLFQSLRLLNCWVLDFCRSKSRSGRSESSPKALRGLGPPSKVVSLTLDGNQVSLVHYTTHHNTPLSDCMACAILLSVCI